LRFKIELAINKSRSEVWKAFDNPENMKKWQKTLVSFEPVSGIPGQPGAVAKWLYKSKDREYSLTEKVLSRDEPNRFESVFENEFASNTVNNVFVEQGKDQTLWKAETKYKFKTLVMKILGPLLKKNYVTRSQRDMERFKDMVESE
jgi:uncharacterized protein YndB with AHSA1/START domain